MKDSWNSTSIIPLTFYSLIFLFTFNFRDVFGVPTKHLCRPEQRDALLELKKEFEIKKPCFDDLLPKKTESWANNSDCCYWDGITCNAKSGEVIELDLTRSCLQGLFHSNTSLFRVQNLRFLTTLDLSYNYFSGQIPSSIGNFSHLTTLDLSKNYFSGFIPSSIGNLSHLTFLDLSGNDFIGEMPFFGSLNQLTNLNVDSNELSGIFPLSLLNLKKLSDLSLSRNQFTGTLPSNMSSLSNLEYFEAWGNGFTGTLPSSLFTIPSLTSIDLRNNQLNGTLEFGNISSPSTLTVLDISNNNFIGPIPNSISKFINLQDLDLSHLNTQGPVDFSIFMNLKSLLLLNLSHLNTTTTIDLNGLFSSHLNSIYSMDLSGNHVSATTKSSVADHHPTQLISQLFLSGCGITEFPELLRSQHKLTNLDISNNKIKGQVPGWLWTLPKLIFVDLSSNTFSGFERSMELGLPFITRPSMQYLVGSNNNFTGKIPSFICALRSLITLDLSDNNLNGSIPHCMGNLKSLVMELVRILKIYTALDFSENKFEGEIPRSIGLLKELHVLNFSSNTFTGHIPSSMGNLRELESLDVSQNKLSGEIPQELGNLSFLAYMNFSHNQLGGLVPGGTQFRRQNCSSFKDNPGLYGSSLEEICVDMHAPAPQQHEPPESEEEDREMFSWIAAAIGFGPGIAFGLTIGYILAFRTYLKNLEEENQSNQKNSKKVNLQPLHMKKV
ncbi:unnamed protein product [Arabidopsis lyrata]|nr:unnamed protein product [Arabidopsis lyrata]